MLHLSIVTVIILMSICATHAIELINETLLVDIDANYVRVEGNNVFLFQYDDGESLTHINIFDCGDPTTPILRHSYSLAERGCYVGVPTADTNDSLLVIGDLRSGCNIYRHDADTLVFISHVNGYGGGYLQVQLYRNLLLIQNPDGIDIVNLNNIYEPESIATLYLNAGISCLNFEAGCDVVCLGNGVINKLFSLNHATIGDSIGIFYRSGDWCRIDMAYIEGFLLYNKYNHL